MRIAAGWDHRGREFREAVERVLDEMGHEMVDLGASTGDPSDYPDYAFRVAEAVARGDAERGLLICGTGMIYTCGVVWLVVIRDIPLAAALSVGVFPFLLGDTLKIAAALSIARFACPLLEKRKK